MKKIKLTQDKIALIDDCMLDLVSEYKWHMHTSGTTMYAVAWINNKHVYMHRFLIEFNNNKKLLSHEHIDHINGNSLDNRIVNLRLATKSQNAANCRIRIGSSQYKGVSWMKQKNAWRARITHNNKEKHLGLFESDKEAALEYNKAALKYFGEFARLNNIP